MEDFINRTYTKKELGLMYFPESMPRTAVNHLMSWIRRCQPLWDELQQMGYEKTCKSFTPKQVKAIIDNLGATKKSSAPIPEPGVLIWNAESV